MKALSVKQPWAWALVKGFGGVFKDVENRSWKPSPKLLKVGDAFLIHASGSFDLKGYRWILENRDALGIDIDDIPGRDEFPLGAIVGAAEFGGVVEDDLREPRTAPAVCSSPWYFGPLGWLIPKAQVLADPIPCKGRLGLWDADEVLSFQRLEKGSTTEGAEAQSGTFIPDQGDGSGPC